MINNINEENESSFYSNKGKYFHITDLSVKMNFVNLICLTNFDFLSKSFY